MSGNKGQIARTILKGFLIILANAIGFMLSQFIYHGPAKSLMNNTDTGWWIEFAPMLFILVGALALMAASRWFRRYGFGITAILISLFYFGLYFLNEAWSKPGEYKAFELRRDFLDRQGQYSVKVDFINIHNQREISLAQAVWVDSIMMRVDPGFFGMSVLSDQAKIIPKENCGLTSDLDSLSLEEIVDQAVDLSYSRCFGEARRLFEAAIARDSTNAGYYFELANCYFAMGAYQGALANYAQSFHLRFDGLSTTDLEKQVGKELLEKFKTAQGPDGKMDVELLMEIAKEATSLPSFEEYNLRMDFCETMITP